MIFYPHREILTMSLRGLIRFGNVMILVQTCSHAWCTFGSFKTSILKSQEKNLLYSSFFDNRSFTGTSSDDCRQKYKYATAESDETMTRLTTKDLDCVVEVNSPSSSSNHRECDGRLVVESRRVETQAHEQSPPPYGWSINSNSNVPDQRQQGNTTEHGFPTSWDNMPSSSL